VAAFVGECSKPVPSSCPSSSRAAPKPRQFASVHVTPHCEVAQAWPEHAQTLGVGSNRPSRRFWHPCERWPPPASSDCGSESVNTLNAQRRRPTDPRFVCERVRDGTNRREPLRGDFLRVPRVSVERMRGDRTPVFSLGSLCLPPEPRRLPGAAAASGGTCHALVAVAWFGRSHRVFVASATDRYAPS